MTPAAANDNTPLQRPRWFDDLLLQYEPFMRRRCRTLAIKQDPEDTYQEAVATAIRRWQKFRPGKEAGFVTWLDYVCRSAAAKVRNSDAKENHLEYIDEYDSAALPDQEQAADIALMLRACSPEQREAITLAAAGIDYADIGKAEGLTRQGIHLRIQEGRMRIMKKARQADAIESVVAANDNNRKSDAAA